MNNPTDSGLYTATPSQRERVRAVLIRLAGPRNARHIDEIASLASVPERKARDAYSELDGDALVIGKNPDGLFAAETPEQAAALDAELLSKLRAIAERLRARRAYWKRQTEVKQLSLSDLMQRSA